MAQAIDADPEPFEQDTPMMIRRFGGETLAIGDPTKNEWIKTDMFPTTLRYKQ